MGKGLGGAEMTRLTVRRIAYVVAALAALVSGVTGGWGFATMVSAVGAPGLFWAFAAVPIILATGVLAALMGVFLFIARRPYGWGKLLCLAGLPWIGFSAVSWLQGEVWRALPYNPLLLGPGLRGATLLIVGLFSSWLTGGDPSARCCDADRHAEQRWGLSDSPREGPERRTADGVRPGGAVHR